MAERDGEFVVTCDLPGFDREDIDVRVTDNTLHIHVEREAEEEVEEEEYIHRERRHADISRSVPLPEDIEREDVTASYENGVLTVTLPKERAEAEAGHEVTIS